MSEWKVTMNPIADRKYGLYKIINPDKVDHSGNRKNYEEWYETRKEAEEKAKYLNIMEAQNAKQRKD